MTIIGRVEYIADIDGKKLPAAARKIGRAAGDELGKGVEDRLDSRFDHILSAIGKDVAARMREHGRVSGLNFSNALERSVQSKLGGLEAKIADVFSSPDGLDDFIKGFDDAGDGIDRMRVDLNALRDAGSLSDWQFSKLANSVNKYSAELDVAKARTIDARFAQSDMILTATKLNRALDELANDKLVAANNATMENFQFNRALDEQYQKVIRSMEERQQALDDEDDALIRAHETNKKVTTSSDRVTRSLGDQTTGWKNLSANTRQWILIGAAIAASAEEIAVLGSAAGSSLTVLAGALGASAIAGGTAIAAFQGMTGDLSELNEVVRPAAEALQGFTAQFGILQDAIQSAAMDQAAGAFESLRVTVEALEPAFVLVADAVGRVIDMFAASIAPGTEGFQNIYDLIAASAPIFETLAGAAFTFGTALGDIFVAAAPFVQIFATYLQDLANRFLEWTNSIEGQTALADWFGNGITIMQAIEPLIGAVADALNALVTPETVAMTVAFLESMTEFIPILGEILGVIGELDLLNVFAELLLAVGEALMPLMPAFRELAASLSDTLFYAISALAEPLQTLMISLGPLLPILAQLVGAFIAMAIEAIVPLVDAMSTDLIPELTRLFDAIIPLLPSLVQLSTVIGMALAQALIAVMPILIPLIDLVVLFFQALEPLIPVITLLVQSALGPLVAIIQVVSGVIGVMISIITAVLKPITDMARDIFEATDAFDGINEMVNDSISFFSDWGDSVSAIIGNVIDAIDNALGWFADLFSAGANAPSAAPSSGSRSGNGSGFAAGGIAAYAAHRLTGEAGREAIVPLQRPLAAVDPSVRTLAAFAQGKLGQMGMGGGGKSVTFAEGAIIVQTVSPDGRLIAEAVVDRIAADADI